MRGTSLVAWAWAVCLAGTLHAASLKVIPGEVDPGGSVTLVVRWEERERGQSVQWVLPAGATWVASEPAPPPLDRGSLTSFGHLRLDPAMPAGLAKVELILQDGARAEGAVEVRRKVGWSAFAERRSDLVGETGDTLTWPIRLVNQGNAPLRLEAEAGGDPRRLRVEVTPRAVVLGPGETGTIDARFRLREPGAMVVESIGSVSIEDGEGRRETLRRPLVFIPERPRVGSLHDQLAGSIRLGAFRGDREGEGSETATAWGLNINGDLGKDWEMDLDLQDSVTVGVGAGVGLSGRDRAALILERPGFVSEWGDLRGPRSGLLDRSRIGRGVHARWGDDDEPVAFGVHVLRESINRRPVEEAGVSMRRGATSFGVLAQRRTGGDPGTEADRWGGWISRDWTIGETFELEAELAYAEGELGGAAGGGVTARWSPSDWDFQARWRELEDAFHLEGTSDNQQSASVTRRLGRGFVVGVDHLRSESFGLLRTLVEEAVSEDDPDADPDIIEFLLRTSGSTERSRASIGWRQRDTHLRVEGQTVDRRRDDPDDTRVSREESIRVQGGFKAGLVRTTLALDVGREGLRGGTATDFTEASVDLSARLFEAVDVSLRHRETLADDSPDLVFRRSGRATDALVSYRTRDGRIRLQGGATRYETEGLESRIRWIARASTGLGRGTEVGLEVAATRGQGWGAFLILRQDFGLPALWREPRSAVTGRLLASDGSPLAGVRVRAVAATGEGQAITNRDGEFALPPLPPGKVDLAWEVPADQTPGEDWPTTVALEPGERLNLELGAPEWGVVVGRLSLLRRGEAQPFPGGLVRFRGPGVSTRVHTGYVGRDGTFRLRLPPGLYAMTVEADLPEAVLRLWDEAIEVRAGNNTIQRAVEEPIRPVRRRFFGRLAALDKDSDDDQQQDNQQDNQQDQDDQQDEAAPRR